MALYCLIALALFAVIIVAASMRSSQISRDLGED